MVSGSFAPSATHDKCMIASGRAALVPCIPRGNSRTCPTCIPLYLAFFSVQWLKCVGTQGNGVPAPLIVGRYCSCTSKFIMMHRNRRRNATGTAVRCIWPCVQNSWSLIKHKYRLWKRKANMVSNIHSHQHLMGPALMAGGSRWNLGAHAENGSSLTSDFPL